jgi:predicted nucleotidyltransferase component of viral defense system
MISKQAILAVASDTGLLPTTIEKDYVLSWVLHGISNHPKLSEWFFKGGTCLKKCYFETYRFSEDLDFTVSQESIYEKKDIQEALNDVAEIVYQNIGINLKTQQIEVTESINKKRNKTYTAKFTYLGPLGLPSRTQQRIKFDITNDEVIIDLPDVREVFHPYSDIPATPAKIKCYSVNEILAEKTRAIYERQGRARDIYDIVNISRNFREHVDIEKARQGLRKKFDFKSLPVPSVDLIFSQIDFAQLDANWKGQLGHQVQVLPSAESFYTELQPALSWWVDEHPVEQILPMVSNQKEEKTLPRVYFPETTTQHLRRLGVGRQRENAYNHFLDHIRYAARNRLCVEIQHHGITRLVEPYSLRQPRTGNVLLYVYELARGMSNSGGIRAYKIAEINNAHVTQQSFSPRYVVEL